MKTLNQAAILKKQWEVIKNHMDVLRVVHIATQISKCRPQKGFIPFPEKHIENMEHSKSAIECMD